jgi:uncharacterized lipoprotein YajG
MRLIVTLLASLILLTACASGPATEGFCATAKPIMVSRSDVLTDGTARQILAHNEYGERVCAW